MKWLLVIIIGWTLVTLPPCAEARAKKTYALSMNIFKKLEQAQLLVEEEQYDEAITDLNALLEKRSSDYEKAQIHNLIGSIYYRKSDYNAALTAFANILEFSDNMPVSLHQQTLKTLTQLNMMQEDYAKAKFYCEQLVAVAEVPEQRDYALLAQANFKLEDWQGAKNAALKGREIAYSQDSLPDENILILLNAAYFETGQLNDMPAVLEELIKHYPKTSYILYLASIYGQLDRYDKQLVLMEALYDDNKLTDRNQMRNLATLYMSERTPYKGAKVLQEAIDSGLLEATERDLELLAQAWRLAAEREKALVVLGQAAQISESGKTFLQKAYLHFDMAQWNLAQESVMLGLDKGLEEKYRGEAWLLLGMTRFKLKDFDSAIEACEKAKDYEDSIKHAQQWITYISTEQQKYESMQAPVG